MKAMHIVFATIAASLCGFAPVAAADILQGTWSGSGYVKPSKGERENVKCRVTYSPAGSKVVGVTATCASSSVTLHQTGELSLVSPGRYVGDFYNAEYDVSGRIQVSVSGSSQTVTLSGPRGGGSLSLSRR
jgi:hypothetical protein